VLCLLLIVSSFQFPVSSFQFVVFGDIVTSVNSKLEAGNWKLETIYAEAAF
jgi:hypothetical protein